MRFLRNVIMRKIHTVIAILEAKSDKTTELKEALVKVTNFSRKEKIV